MSATSFPEPFDEGVFDWVEGRNSLNLVWKLPHAGAAKLLYDPALRGRVVERLTAHWGRRVCDMNEKINKESGTGQNASRKLK
jgi:hypothetical protein